MPKSARKHPVTPERIMQLQWAFAPPLMLHAAVQNRIFDVLDEGPKTLAQIASATGAAPRGVRALVEALAAIGVLRRKGPRFSLAPDISAFLVRNKPGFLGGMLQHLMTQILPNWIKIPDAVRTGRPIHAVNQELIGADFFSAFVEDIYNLSRPSAQALAQVVARHCKAARWATRVNVLDIAAGSGVWGLAIAERLPQAHVTAVDWSGVTPVTRKVAVRLNLADRLSVIEGDILQADFGHGYHVATLGHILHSEGEARSRQLLKKVFDALAPGGMIAIAEFSPNTDRSGPAFPLMFAVNMLVETEAGDTFSQSEMRGWLAEIGFTRIQPVRVPAPTPILLAVKPSRA
jgi:ubiquinone/menaquinone biosynthesis C-methylase UbiE